MQFILWVKIFNKDLSKEMLLLKRAKYLKINNKKANNTNNKVNIVTGI